MVADVLVVGGGINGAAVAREAALDGLRVTLVEAGDLASGTSSASSRLVHGGIRYLENGEVRLVRQSLAERERLLHTAPHLVRPYPLLIPMFDGNRRGRRTIRAGMLAYDLLSPDKTTPRHRMLSAAATARRYPGLATDGLRGAALYHDAIAPAAERLVVEQALDAAALGATVLTHRRVSTLDRSADGTLVAGLADGESLRARVVVNCAGPWVDDVLGTTEPRRSSGEASARGAGRSRLIGGTKGSHLVVAAFPGAPGTGVHYEADDGRAVLVLPQPDGSVLIGATDTFVDGGDAGVVTADEVDYLLAQVNRLIPAAGLGQGDVLGAYCGVRPLPHSDATTAAGVSRDHEVVADPVMPGLFSVVGGKLTTHRALAEDVLRTIGLRRPGRHTRRLPLPGGRCADWPSFRARFSSRTDRATSARLLDLYGVRAEHVLATAGDPIPGTPAVEGEVVVALRAEFAVTLTDVMARRLLLSRRPDLGLGCAAAVADVCSRVAGWSPERTRTEIDGYRDWARTQLPIQPEHTRST